MGGWRPFLFLFGGLLFASTSGPFFLASGMDAYTTAFSRMALAGGLLLGVELLRRPPWSGPGAESWRRVRALLPSILLGAAIFALHLLLWTAAFSFTSLGSSALLIVAQPAMAMVIGGLFGERFRPAMGVSIALAALAVFLVAAGDLEIGPSAWIGDGMCLLAALCVTLFIPVTQAARRALPMSLFLGLTFSFGAVLLAPFLRVSNFAIVEYGWREWRWLLGIVFVSTIGGHGLTNLAARRLSLFRMQVVTLLQPLLVLAIGAHLLDVRTGSTHLGAAALLVLAVAVGLWGTRERVLLPTRLTARFPGA
ncbi:MAG TPA: DMT family transporter [Fredinandcohnia sp.]|nr:DMT family transporter [Fredinandcohnia sp.]